MSSVASRGLRIAVLFGGTSAERDVSIVSSAQIVRALRSRGHHVVAIDTALGILDQSGERALFEAKVGTRPPTEGNGLGVLAIDPVRFFADPRLQGIDLAFLGMHGGAGEDGHLQALLDLQGIPYTGSGMLASACAMDKDVAKRLMRLAGVPTADWLMAPPASDHAAHAAMAAKVEAQLGWPVVVKASKQGSTVGLSVVRQADQLPAAIAQAYLHDDEVLLERFVPGRELTVGILDGQALAVGEIVLHKGEIFDYQAKYQPGGVSEVFPAVIDAAVAGEVQRLGVQVAHALKLRDYCRVDFRFDPHGRLWCLEANTLPGMTAMSLLPQSAAAVGMSFERLCEAICNIALARSARA